MKFGEINPNLTPTRDKFVSLPGKIRREVKTKESVKFKAD